MKNLLIILFLGLVNLQAGDIKYKISDIPEDLMENADHVILEESNNIMVLSAARAEKQYKGMIAVLEDDSYYRDYSVYFDKFTNIDKLRLTVYDQFGDKIETYKRKDFSDYPAGSSELYTEDRLLYVDLEKFKTPYIIEIEQVSSHKEDLIYGDFVSQSYYESVLSTAHSISYPIDIPFQYKVFNNAPEPIRSSSEGFEKLSWSFSELPALEYESMGPSSSNFFPYVSIRPTKFRYDGYDGNMSTWEDYNDFYYELNSDRDELSEEMKTYIHDHTDALESDMEKIDALYTYLKDNMRYVSVQLGIGGWQTFDAAYVEHNKFGDCKALSNFMGSMLSEVGIDNNKVIIHRGLRGYRELKEDFVNTPFNHAMLYIPSEDMFLECTSNNYPAGYLGLDNANKKVLVVSSSGPTFMRTPSMGTDKNKTETITYIEFADNGQAEIKASCTYHGGDHDRLRNSKDRVTDEEMEKGFLKSYPLPVSSLDKLEIKIHKGEPVADFEYELTTGKYASKAGKRFFIPLDPINNTVNVPKSIDDRKLPFTSLNESITENQLVIMIPEGYELESVPNKDFSKESDFGDLRLSVSVEDDTIKVYEKYISKKFVKTAEDYEAYRDTMKEYSKALNSKIVLVKKKT